MNEPVTWATEDLQNVMSPKFKEMRMDTSSSTWKQFPIPLYTHPPMRELSEEEILEVWKENYGDVNISNFARAILKKASEK
jgi:hypothetical protein